MFPPTGPASFSFFFYWFKKNKCITGSGHGAKRVGSTGEKGRPGPHLGCPSSGPLSCMGRAGSRPWPRGLMVMSHLLCLLCFAPKGKHISSYRPHQPQASCSKREATSAGIFGIYFCVILDSSVIFQKYITGPAACLLCKYFCPIIIIIMILNRVLNTSCIPGAAARERGAITTLIFQTNTRKVR